MSTPHSGNLSAVQRLRKELIDLKNQTTTGVDKFNNIVEELRKLNAADIPPKLSLYPLADTNDDACRLCHP